MSHEHSLLLCRRHLLLSVGAAAFLPAFRAFGAAPGYRVIVEGLQAPESPKPQPDGSILVCEMARGTLSRVTRNRKIEVVAELGGAPNGVAIGPDGAAYVCNNGGFKFVRQGKIILPSGPLDVPGPAAIQRVDLKTGASTTLYRAAGSSPLQSPNDLVFDATGGFWFTDPRMAFPGQEGPGTVNYARPDGSEARVVCGLAGNNGIALSPDGNTLYVARTQAHEVVAYRITAPGKLEVGADDKAVARPFGRIEGKMGFDSMAVDEAGYVLLGTLNLDTSGDGALTVFKPDGSLAESIALPEKFVTSVGFGGARRRTAYITLTTTGRLIAMNWPRSGVKLANQ
jgi:gluconolactonase